MLCFAWIINDVLVAALWQREVWSSEPCRVQVLPPGAGVWPAHDRRGTEWPRVWGNLGCCWSKPWWCSLPPGIHGLHDFQGDRECSQLRGDPKCLPGDCCRRPSIRLARRTLSGIYSLFRYAITSLVYTSVFRALIVVAKFHIYLSLEFFHRTSPKRWRTTVWGGWHHMSTPSLATMSLQH